jgi:DeoR/GlpR family transcriptional regulator of sugar metabolism
MYLYLHFASFFCSFLQVFDMIAEERRALLLTKLREDGYIQVTDLAEEFNISSATIRRDLILLEQEGICIRKRGGAVRSTQSVTMELPYDVKQHRRIDEKNRIAKAAINLVENGDTILLDAGSTIYQLACLLHTKERLTIVTHDLNIAYKLATNPNLNLICTGGIARANVYTLQGAQVVDFIRGLRVDKSFIGADAIHPDGTISNVNIEEVPIKLAMIKAAKQVILLSDSSKFGITGFAKVCEIDELDYLITDSGIPDHFRKICEQSNVKVLVE